MAIGMISNAVAFIDSSALSHNLSQVRRLCPESKVIAVVKANAYGFGVENVCSALTNTDAFAVATVSEAVRLRECGVSQPIYVLHGVRDAPELSAAIKLKLTITVHNERQLLLLGSHGIDENMGQSLPVWLKINTGMNRLGCTPKEALQIWAQLHSISWVKPIGILTHFACSDIASHALNEEQLSHFNCVLKSITKESGRSCEVSIASSAGILNLPKTRIGWVRPGIMLYGGSCTQEHLPSNISIRPVMTLCSRIIAIQSVSLGQSIGYGATFTAPRDMTIAVVAIGYGDGYPRHIAEDQQVAIHGKLCQVVGRVSMDMITVDISALIVEQPVSVDDRVELWGDQVSVDQLAMGAGTTSYELFCQLTNRVERVVIPKKEG